MNKTIVTLFALVISCSAVFGSAQPQDSKTPASAAAERQTPDGSDPNSGSTSKVPKPNRSDATMPPPVSANREVAANDAPAKSAVVTPKTASKPAVAERALTEIYRVGVGDVLDIRLLNSVIGRSTLFTVIGGGLIDLPLAGGPVQVAGLTADEIQNYIAAELKRRALEEGSRVSVSVRQFASHSVVVTGLVASPGTRFLRREAVPLYVLLAETQLRNDAGRVVLMRNGTTGQPLDLNDPFTMNTTVMSGDVVSVLAPLQEFYYIAGRINYPGQKPFQKGISLLQAILAAGGTPKNESIIEISREAADGRLVTTSYNLKRIKLGEIGDPKLQPGDRLQVVK